MSLVIGFATEFYTLWDVFIEPVFRTDAYGKHWHVSDKTNFNYIQNVSKDFDKAVDKYPNVPIDDSLRGKTRSFSVGGGGLELSPVNIIWFGKYSGQDLNDVVKRDLKYVMWLLENANDGRMKEFIMTLTEVQQELYRIESEKEAFFSSIPVLQNGAVDIMIESNPREYQIQSLNKVVFAMRASLGEGSFLYLIPEDVKYIAGSYKYPEWYMPVLGGKAKRLKGKTVKLNVEVIETERLENGYYKGIHQFAKIL